MARSILTPFTFSAGGNAINNNAAATVPLTIKGAASQSANLLELQSSAGTILSSFTSSGVLNSSSGTYENYNADSTIRAEFRGTAGTHRPYIELQGVGANDVTNENGGAFIRFRTSRSAGYGADIGAIRKPTGASQLIFKTGTATVDAITQKMTIDENGNVLINGFASGTIGLTVRGASGQTANLYEIQNNSSVVLGGVTPAGRLYVQRQEGIQFMDGAATLRSRIYSSGNNGVYFDTGGGAVRVLTLDGGSETITGNIFYPYSSGRIGLIVRGVASQSANLQEWQDSTPTTVTTVNSAGLLSTTRNITIAETNTAENAFIIRGAASHTGYLTLWQNSSATILSGVNAPGQIWTGSTIPTQGSTSVAINTQSPTGTTNITITTATAHGISVGQTVNIAGVVPSGYNGNWTAQAGTTGSTLVVNIGSAPGSITTGGLVYMSPQISITPSSTNTSGLIVKALASQSANLLEIQSSAGAVLARFSSSGQLVSDQQTYIGSGATSISNARLNVATGSASVIGAVIRGAASQSADYLQIQNSAGTVQLKVDSGGYATSIGWILTSSTGSFENAFGGALLAMKKTTSTVTSPAADTARFFIKDGTTAGTLKLVAKTGTAGVEETIVDNLSSTGSTAGAQFVGAGGVNTAGALVTTSSVTTGAALNLNYASPTIASNNASAASIFTATVTGVTIGSSTIRTTAFPADATTSTAAAGLGYMGIPQNSTTTGAYTIVAGDAGEHIYSTATRTVTIPANGTVAFPVGTTITFISGSGATTTIAITTDTMYLAGPGTTGSRTLAAFGMATAVKITSTAWIISGNGLT